MSPLNNRIMSSDRQHGNRRGRPVVSNTVARYEKAHLSRFAALTFLAENHRPEIAKLFVPLGQVATSSISGIADKSRGMIRGNESASGVIPPDRITKAQGLLESMAHLRGTAGLPLLETALDSDSLDSLRAALDYCRQNKLAMIEAADVVVPFTNQCMTDDKNLRAPFLGKMEP